MGITSMCGHHQHTHKAHRQTVVQNREIAAYLVQNAEKEISPTANFIKQACRNFKMYEASPFMIS